MSEQPLQLDTLHVQVKEVPLRKLSGGPDRMFVQTDGTGKVLVDFADGVNEWGKALELDEAQYEALRQEAFQRELADLQDIPTYTELYPPAGHGGAITSPNGNTLGRVNGETPPMGKTADGSNADVDSETPAEGVTGEQVLDGIQLGLDIVGLIPVVGEIADVANAGISLSRGDYAGAALSLLSAIPFVGYLGTAGKVGRYGTKAAAEASAKAANQMAKRANDKTANEIVENISSKATNKKNKNRKKRVPPGGKSKGRKKLKCGEYGKYGDLKRKNGKGKYDRDHIPSKAALKARAEALKGEKLTKAEAQAIERWGNSIAVPRQAHIDISPTYGQTSANAARDAKDLAGSARRDVEAMLERIDEYDADGGCKKAYIQAAKRVLKDNDWFDKRLNDLINRGLRELQ